MAESLEARLRDLSKEVRELYIGNRIERVRVSHVGEEEVSLRDAYAWKRPLVIQGALALLPAMEKWNRSYLEETMAGREVSVSLTPDGRADAVVKSEEDGKEYFVQPCITKTDISDVYAAFTKTWDEFSMDGFPKGSVAYISLQNDSLRSEFGELLPDVLPKQLWRDVFGNEPDAINLWIGNEKSVTTFHKDHYENIFCVIRGSKTFSLLPPTDFWRLSMKEYPNARWTSIEGRFEIVPEHGKTRWSPIDLTSPDHTRRFPKLFDEDIGLPLTVTLNAGEYLYLPALWYHFVEQNSDHEGACISVNCWYDMRYDMTYAMSHALEKMYNDARDNMKHQ